MIVISFALVKFYAFAILYVLIVMQIKLVVVVVWKVGAYVVHEHESKWQLHRARGEIYRGKTRTHIYIYYLPAGRSVLRKTVPEVLSTALGLRPRAVLKTEGTVFLNTDRPRPANNIFIFFLLFFKS